MEEETFKPGQLFFYKPFRPSCQPEELFIFLQKFKPIKNKTIEMNYLFILEETYREILNFRKVYNYSGVLLLKITNYERMEGALKFYFLSDTTFLRNFQTFSDDEKIPQKL
jgi:hypothetical protein